MSFQFNHTSNVCLSLIQVRKTACECERQTDRQTERHSNVETPSSPMLVFPLVATLHCNCVTGQQLRSQDSQLIKQQMNQTKIYESTLRCNFFIPLTEVTLSPKHEI